MPKYSGLVIFVALKTTMKNLNLFINILLVIAVVVLFALQMSSKSEKPSNSNNSINGSHSSSGLNIAYVNADSLTENYEMYKDEFEKA